VTIELSINQGIVSIRDIEVFDQEITVNEFIEWAFTKGHYPFTKPNAAIYDRY